MRNQTELHGIKFGRLTPIDFSGKIGNRTAWVCLCDCGAKKLVLPHILRSGRVASCGCLGLETRAANGRKNKRHGMCKSKEFAIWSGMIGRCHNKNSYDYHNYGARGIVVCERWLNSFENFYADMGDKPFPGAQIDRKNNDGNYEPENCKWSTSLENNNNRRNTTRVEYKGETLAAKPLSRKFGIKYNTFLNRIKKGLSVDNALNTPTRSYVKRMEVA